MLGPAVPRAERSIMNQKFKRELASLRSISKFNNLVWIIQDSILLSGYLYIMYIIINT